MSHASWSYWRPHTQPDPHPSAGNHLTRPPTPQRPCASPDWLIELFAGVDDGPVPPPDPAELAALAHDITAWIRADLAGREPDREQHRATLAARLAAEHGTGLGLAATDWLALIGTCVTVPEPVNCRDVLDEHGVPALAVALAVVGEDREPDRRDREAEIGCRIGFALFDENGSTAGWRVVLDTLAWCADAMWPALDRAAWASGVLAALELLAFDWPTE